MMKEIIMTMIEVMVMMYDDWHDDEEEKDHNDNR
jgi:hypothetical protein